MTQHPATFEEWDLSELDSSPEDPAEDAARGVQCQTNLSVSTTTVAQLRA
jgi:hypothetical protein